MTTPANIEATAYKAQLEKITKAALTSTDECVVATLIAALNKDVEALSIQKSSYSVWKGTYCEKRSDGKIAVVFNFECPPGVFCLVKPWFAAIVDLEFATVSGIQDPYRPQNQLAALPCKCVSPTPTPNEASLRRPPECVACQNIGHYGDLVDALKKAKDSGEFGDKRGCRTFVDDAAFRLYLLNVLLLSEPVADIIIAAAQGCGHCACNHDVF